jgi:hypothetical protein
MPKAKIQCDHNEWDHHTIETPVDGPVGSWILQVICDGAREVELIRERVVTDDGDFLYDRWIEQ